MKYILLILSFVLLSCSDSNDNLKTGQYHKGKDAFEDYLSETLSNYIEERVENLVDDQTFFFSLHPYRMVKHSFCTEDSVRISYWTEKINEEISSDSIQKILNKEIDTYNKYNSTKLHHISIEEIPLEKVVNGDCYDVIKKMELCGAYDVIDVLAPVILIIVLSIISGLGVAVFDVEESDRLWDSITEVNCFISGLIAIAILFYVSYKFCIYSSEVEALLHYNILNNLLFQN